MWLALKIANDKGTVANKTLNQLLLDHVLAGPTPMSFDEALKQENETLKGQVKTKEL